MNQYAFILEILCLVDGLIQADNLPV